MPSTSARRRSTPPFKATARTFITPIAIYSSLRLCPSCRRWPICQNLSRCFWIVTTVGRSWWSWRCISSSRIWPIWINRYGGCIGIRGTGSRSCCILSWLSWRRMKGMHCRPWRSSKSGVPSTRSSTTKAASLTPTTSHKNWWSSARSMVSWRKNSSRSWSSSWEYSSGTNCTTTHLLR